jgi:hypothetical protein
MRQHKSGHLQTRISRLILIRFLNFSYQKEGNLFSLKVTKFKIHSSLDWIETFVFPGMIAIMRLMSLLLTFPA